MKNPSHEEAIYMVETKRKRAKDALATIVDYFGTFSMRPAPGLDVLLEYFTNMVYGIELIMKVLAQNWKNHKVGAMYEKIFSRPHSNSGFMLLLEGAIKDQKFLYEPDLNLLDRVPEIEALWDELKGAYYQPRFRKVEHVYKEVLMGTEFCEYLVNNVERFYPRTPIKVDHHTTEQKIQMRRFQIACLEKEIQQLEESGEPPEYDPFKETAAAQVEFEKKLWLLSETMRERFQSLGNQIPFGTWRSQGVVTDFLG